MIQAPAFYLMDDFRYALSVPATCLAGLWPARQDAASDPDTPAPRRCLGLCVP
ncbi:MAG: hypothetical protein MZV49_05980 [Rhodopseudomonas palustris]|nr:hypothetical protein [Rhodopseudomonas palustris]